MQRRRCQASGCWRPTGRREWRVGAALVAVGIFLAVFTTIRYQAALVVAVAAILDHRAITGRSALARAGARWKDLAGWSLIELAVGPMLHLVARGRARRQHQITRAIASAPVEATWPLISLLVLPVVMIEQADVASAIRRSEQLSSTRWGNQARCRVPLDCGAITMLLPCGIALVLGATARALWRDKSPNITGGLIAVSVGVILAITRLASRNASRAVLAVTLFRYARDGRADDPFDATTLRRAVTPTPNLIHLLTTSGALVAWTGRPTNIDRRRLTRQQRR